MTTASAIQIFCSCGRIVHGSEEWERHVALHAALQDAHHAITNEAWQTRFQSGVPGESPRPCPDCAAAIGALHAADCDVERCPACGGQRISCQCQTDLLPLPWLGFWPGEQEAVQLGLWCRWGDHGGWEPCAADAPGARPHLTRLYDLCRWDPEQRILTTR